jgi:hypothetical protein
LENTTKLINALEINAGIPALNLIDKKIGGIILVHGYILT